MVNFCLCKCVLFSLVILLSACEAKSASAVSVQIDEEGAVPSRQPTLQEVSEITAPNYKSPVGVKMECFGRLVFEMTSSIEWPVFYNSKTQTLFNRSFSARVGAVGDEMRFGRTLIAVIGSVNGVEKEKVLDDTPAGLEKLLRQRMEETRSYIAELKEKNRGVELVTKEINQEEGWLKKREDEIAEKRKRFEPFDPGLPNSEGYWTTRVEANDESKRYSVLRAYLTRQDHIYVFESTVKMEKPSDKDAHKKDFTAMLARFRTRAPNEIPTEPGVCIPFGFIPDDGRTVVEFKQSLRFPDAPGVLYTIETGTVHPRRLKLAPLTAAAHASINPPPMDENDGPRPVVTQRIGPRSATMGGLTASQGGTVLKAGRPGHEQYEIYSVFTGYSGWLGTAVLPYILVEMRSVTRDRAPELKHNPPPFKQSMERLDLMLKSMRWRPTTPPMREFEQQ